MSVSLRDAKGGYAQVMARMEDELRGITGGIQCPNFSRYRILYNH